MDWRQRAHRQQIMMMGMGMEWVRGGESSGISSSHLQLQPSLSVWLPLQDECICRCKSQAVLLEALSLLHRLFHST